LFEYDIINIQTLINGWNKAVPSHESFSLTCGEKPTLHNAFATAEMWDLKGSKG